MKTVRVEIKLLIRDDVDTLWIPPDVTLTGYLAELILPIFQKALHGPPPQSGPPT